MTDSLRCLSCGNSDEHRRWCEFAFMDMLDMFSEEELSVYWGVTKEVG